MGTWLTAAALNIAIDAVNIDATGTVTVDFTLTDGDDVPVDYFGLHTEGEVSARFVLAWLDQDDTGTAEQYTAYTTRTVTSPITGVTEVQASSDTGGTFEDLDVELGKFRYTFGTTVTVADPTLTHTLGVWAERTVDGERAITNHTHDFRPDGQPVTITRSVVSDASCNSCHDQIALHGGARQSINLCVTCHSPQTVDPDTGNTLDFKVMVHKIHRGEHLPSVEAGGSYQIIGYGQSVNDYSTVVFPREINDCANCHDGAEADAWSTRPSKATCTSCHDDVSFESPPPAGLVLHSGGSQPDDAPCNVCHPATGSLAGIEQVHAVPAMNAVNQVTIDLFSVANSAPGQQPTVTFQVNVGGAPRDILATPLSTLRFTIAGPNTDYASYWQATAQGSGATGTLAAVDSANGIFSYTVPAAAAVPLTATGSYTIGVEAINSVGGVAYSPRTIPIAFAVTDAVAEPRRVVVDGDKCNQCHRDIGAHGSRSRKGPMYCVMCHHPNNTGDERAPHWEGATLDVQTVSFPWMIHKIHAGEELENGYVAGGFPVANASNPNGTQVDFGEARYPGRLWNCNQCHVNDSHTLPIAATLAIRRETRTCTEDPAADTNSYCPPANFAVGEVWYEGPERAACTACHDSEAASAHAEIMTTPSGAESCATCHGTGSEWDVNIVHGLY